MFRKVYAKVWSMLELQARFESDCALQRLSLINRLKPFWSLSLDKGIYSLTVELSLSSVSCICRKLRGGARFAGRTVMVQLAEFGFATSLPLLILSLEHNCACRTMCILSCLESMPPDNEWLASVSKDFAGGMQATPKQGQTYARCSW